jgi:transposase
MSRTTSAVAASTIGIDTGKHTLHLIGLDEQGMIVLREKLARGRIGGRLANVPPCLIGIEAGMGTHYVARELISLGHDVRQVPPAYAKPFRQTDFAAWLGLVLRDRGSPKQMSTGDRTILGRISKRGNRYLRTLFMQGARVILLRPANWAKHSFGPWLTTAAKRLHHNVLATALANKLARIAWTVLAQRRNYETRVIAEAA